MIVIVVILVSQTWLHPKKIKKEQHLMVLFFNLCMFFALGIMCFILHVKKLTVDPCVARCVIDRRTYSCFVMPAVSL